MVEGIHQRELENPPEVEQVHFCRTYISPPMPRDLPGVILEEDTGHWARLAVVRIVFLFVAVVAWGQVADYLSLNKQLVLTVAMLLPAAIVFYWVIRYLRFTHRLVRDGVPRLPPADARLQCVAAPGDLPPLANSCGVMFEPRVYRASYTSRVAVSGLALTWVAVAVLNVTTRVGDYDWNTLLGLGAAAIGLFAFARPVYFRISPGRLEVLRYGFIQREPMEVDEYDLRYAYIVADLHRRRLTVSHSERKGKSYSILLMRERREFLYTLFMAALSKQQAPSLPVDTL